MLVFFSYEISDATTTTTMDALESLVSSLPLIFSPAVLLTFFAGFLWFSIVFMFVIYVLWLKKKKWIKSWNACVFDKTQMCVFICIVCVFSRDVICFATSLFPSFSSYRHDRRIFWWISGVDFFLHVLHILCHLELEHNSQFSSAGRRPQIVGSPNIHL